MRSPSFFRQTDGLVYPPNIECSRDTVLFPFHLDPGLALAGELPLFPNFRFLSPQTGWYSPFVGHLKRTLPLSEGWRHYTVAFFLLDIRTIAQLLPPLGNKTTHSFLFFPKPYWPSPYPPSPPGWKPWTSWTERCRRWPFFHSQVFIEVHKDLLCAPFFFQ